MLEQVVREVEVVEAWIDVPYPIFYTGMLSFEEVLKDEEFGVQAPNQSTLYRVVEVYCWKEEVSVRTERRGNQSR